MVARELRRGSREGFPLGIAVIDLDHPDVTLDRLQRLVKKMVKP